MRPGRSRGTIPAPRWLEQARQCLNFRLRRASRLLNQRYDAALRPVGLRATQFSLMVVVAGRVGIPVSRVAELMGIERSALARNLKPLQRRGWVKVTIGEDRRTRVISWTRAGQRRLEQALPHWRRAQSELLDRLSRRQLHGLLDGLQAAISAARPKP